MLVVLQDTRYKNLYLKSSFETKNFSACELVFDGIVYIAQQHKINK